MSDNNKLKGSQILVRSLLAEGVDTIFGYPGGAVLEIYDELYKTGSKLRHILVCHEQGAAHAADGYARSSGRVGVCLATSGPGATNLVTGLATAHMDSSAVVAITGQVPSHAVGTDAFQESDITGITQPITKHNYLVKDVGDIARVVKEAFYIARTGRQGPVLVDIAKDATMRTTEFEYPKKVDIRGYKPFQHLRPDPTAIDEAVELINKAKQPVIISGGGIHPSGAWKELEIFVNKTNFPISFTLMGLGGMADDHPRSLRMPGMHGTAYANYSIHESDLLIAIGMRFDDRITGKLSEFAKHATIIHIELDPAEIGKSVKAHLPIQGDAKAVLRELNRRKLKPLSKNSPWLKKIEERKKKFPLRSHQNMDDGSEIQPPYVIQMADKLTGGKAIFTTEVGEHQMWAAQFLRHHRPRHFITSGGLGTMGFGFPAAMGAQVANPNKTVIDLAGDGSIMMNIQELMTVVAYKIPVKIFIINNRYLGMVRQWQEMFYENRYSYVDLSNHQPDFVKLADAYGLLGLRAVKPKEVAPVIDRALSHNGPVIVDFQVARSANVYPMVPAGGVLNQMIFEEGSLL